MSHPTITEAAAAFFCNGRPLPGYLPFRDFARMSAAEFEAWCRSRR